MRSYETVLFEKCPLCRQAKITMTKPRRFPFSKPRINPCPKCSAEFAARGRDSYQLVFCEPHKLIPAHNCKDRIFRGCYLDAALSMLEWQQIAEGGESHALSKFMEMSAKFCRGLLPTYPSEKLPFSLKPSEVVHYISSPVSLDEQKSRMEKTSDKGDFFLTNKRMIYVHPLGTFTIPLGNVERVEDSPPGFLVKDKDSFELRYFFPPPYDPLFAAVCGAIHNFKRKA